MNLQSTFPFFIFSFTSGVHQSLLLHIALFTFIACSCQATLASGREREKAGEKDNVPSAPAAVRMLVDIFASQQQPVKIEPEMNGKDLLEREAVPSGPGNGSELSAITSFLLKSQQDDRKGRLAADVPDWKVMNSVECENTFPFVENKSRAVMFMKDRTRLLHVQQSHFILSGVINGVFITEHLSFLCGPASGEELREHISPPCCLPGGNIFPPLTHKIAFGGCNCSSYTPGHCKEGENGQEWGEAAEAFGYKSLWVV